MSSACKSFSEEVRYTVNILKLGTQLPLGPNDADKMTSSVDPDQTAREKKMEEFFAYIRDRISERTARHDNGQCRIWTGPVKRALYGQLKFKDPRDGRLKTRGVHRLALMVSEKIKRLDVPAEQVTSHLCNNPLCVNPGHLVFENQALNNNRSVCFSTHKCDGHGHDSNGNARPACLVQLNDLARSYLKQQQQQQQQPPTPRKVRNAWVHIILSPVKLLGGR